MSTSSKDHILEVALLLIREHGFSQVSTRDVADATGLSRSHLYYYFPDWASLRRASFERFANQELESAQLELARIPQKNVVKKFLEACLPVVDDETWPLWLGAWQEAMRDAEFADVYMKYMLAWEKLLTDAISQGREKGLYHCSDSARVARQLFAMTNGYAHDLLLKPSSRSAKKALEEVLEMASALLGTKC
jgi:AcrR family transcriptional regulator